MLLGDIIEDAIDHKVHVITPSYVTDEIKSFNQKAIDNDVLIDH